MRQTMKLLRESVKNEVLKDVAIATLASFILSLCAPLSLHLPFTPVPVTIQVQVALFLSAFLGARRAVFMILAFITQGLVGLPVFAGGASTIATLIGPRGGYLLGYLAAAYVVGRIYQAREHKSTASLFFSMLLGNAIVYLLGFSWLSNFVGMKRAFLFGVAPFALPDLVKLTMVSLLKRPFASLLNSLSKKL
jgi:biotin transport system substrate-specific component